MACRTLRLRDRREAGHEPARSMAGVGGGGQPGAVGGRELAAACAGAVQPGVAAAQHCGLARVAAVVPGLAAVPSTTRRFERLLANERLDVRAARGAVAATVLEQGPGQTLWLARDETPQGRAETGARLGMLALRLVYIANGRSRWPGPAIDRGRRRRRSPRRSRG